MKEDNEKKKINSLRNNPYAAIGCSVIIILFAIILGVVSKRGQQVAATQQAEAATAQAAREAVAAKEQEARKASVQRGSFTDARDKKAYKTVKIGDQTWMAENLNYNASGSKCYGEGGEVRLPGGAPVKITSKEMQANCVKYGRLYNWNTAIKACPKGWHLPSAEEWQILVDFVGGKEIAGKKLKTKSGWNENGNGLDDYSFSALPGGQGSDGQFLFVSKRGQWWTASECGEDWGTEKAVCNRGIDYDSDDLKLYLGGSKRLFFSVRCLQD